MTIYVPGTDETDPKKQNRSLAAIAAAQSALQNYTQLESGAVSSPLVSRFTNTLFAHEFGAIGDDASNDYTALQAFLTAVATTGKEGHFDPGKSYYVSGGDLTLAMASGVKNIRIFGNGSQIRTDPSQARTGLIIANATAVTRADQTRKVIIDGLQISQFQDGNAAWGFFVSGSAFVKLLNCTVICGSDNATSPSGNYAAYFFGQSDNTNPATGSVWCSMDTCAVQGAAIPTPIAVRLDGQCNAFHMTNCTFANATEGVYLTRCNVAASSTTAQVSNGVRITNCDFEGGTDAISCLGVSGYTTLAGLEVSGCRAESLSIFFKYNLDLNPTSDLSYPSLRQNYVASSVTTPILNSNNLIIDSDTASIPYTPTITSTGGTLTTVTASGAYRLIGKQCSFSVVITVTTIGTGTGKFNLPLPVTTAKRAFTAHVVETASTGKGGSYVVSAGASTGVIQAYDNSTSLMVNGYSITVTGSYEIT